MIVVEDERGVISFVGRRLPYAGVCVVVWRRITRDVDIGNQLLYSQLSEASSCLMQTLMIRVPIIVS